MPSVEPGPVLLCYDGSDGSRRAVEWTGLLLPGAEAIVLYLWKSPAVTGVFAPAAHAGMAQHAEALALASEGVELARAAGLDARPLAAGIGPSWQSILAIAHTEGARLIITGARGLSGARAMLGSVSRGVTEHASVPVLVVPPPNTNIATSAFPPQLDAVSHPTSSPQPEVSGALAPRSADALARYLVLEARKGRCFSEIMNDEYVTKRASETAIHALLDRRDIIEALGREAINGLREQISALAMRRQAAVAVAHPTGTTELA